MSNVEEKIIELLICSYDQIVKDIDLIHRNKKVELFLYPFQFSPVDLLSFLILVEKEFKIRFHDFFIYNYGFISIDSIEKEVIQLLENRNGK